MNPVDITLIEAIRSHNTGVTRDTLLKEYERSELQLDKDLATCINLGTIREENGRFFFVKDY